MKKAPKETKSPGKVETFFRVVAYPLAPNDGWRGYQVEEIKIQDNRVVGREFVGKKDTKQQIMGEIELSIDPDQPLNEAI